MSVVIEPLRARDLDAGLALSTAVGWNQTSADWRRLLQLAPTGCFAAWVDDRLAGTVTTTIYAGELAWIGMVIVHPDLRRRGIGAALLRRALDHLDDSGVSCVKLDATPAGFPLYRRLGFDEEVRFDRWQGVAAPIGPSSVAPAEPLAIESLLPLDGASFGADRSRLLSALAGEALAAYVVPAPGSAATGYALARAGRSAIYLGPLVATDERAAAALLDALLARFAGRDVCIDVNSAGLLDRRRLERGGLRPTRPLIRMRRGGASMLGTPPALCASAGPEYG